MTREEALEAHRHTRADEETMAQEFEYVATKLGWTVAELEAISEATTRRSGLQEQHVFHQARREDVQLLGLDNRIIR